MRERAFNWFALLALTSISFAACNRKPTLETPARQTVAVAAAADLKFALDDIVADFQKAHPSIQVQITYGSSGSFYSQLSQRAPFDLFLSADVLYPTRLTEAGLAVAESKFLYAVGRIVVWVPTNSTIDPVQLGIASLQHPAARKIAIANPEHAPYGKSAVAAMQKLGVYDVVKERLVFGENVAQSAQFIESGSADIGVIALSLALAPAMKSKGRYWEIPFDAYPRMEQGGVILTWARNPEAAQELRAFVLSPSGKSVLRRYGFFMPNE